MFKNKYVFWISKITYVGIIFSIIGFIFIVQGILNSYNSTKVMSIYQEKDIHLGRYIDCDILREQLLGKFYTEMNGKKVYSPITGNYVYTNAQQYIFLEDIENMYYVTLNVPKEYTEEFKELIAGNVSEIHIFGKFKKLKGELYYDEIMSCLGINNRDEIDKIVSKKYVIQIVDPEMERNVYYKGGALLIIGILCLLKCLEKKKVEIEKSVK